MHYRIQQLEAKKIIQSYPAIISLAKRGKIHAEMYIRFHNVTVPLKNEIINFFKEQKETVFVASCKGSWDLLLEVVVNDLEELNNFKNKICDAYSTYFTSSSLGISIETYFYGRKYLMGKHIHTTQHIDKLGNEKIDEIDEKILHEIAKNTRISILEIARNTGISAKTVAYRIKRMTKNKIIQKFTVSLNMEALGMTTYKLLIRLKNSKHKKRLLEYFHHQPNTVNVREVLSEWNLEPTFEVKNSEEFYIVIEDIEKKFGEIIMNHTALMIDKIFESAYYK